MGAEWDEVPAVVRGPESRDAAVVEDAAGPRSDAFLPPVNAGKADPHGPLVVSPSIHATTPGPIVPGPVTVARQADVEAEVAERVLVNNEPVPQVTASVSSDAPAPATPSEPDPAAAQEAAKTSSPRRQAKAKRRTK